jgi:hypothetical protein
VYGGASPAARSLRGAVQILHARPDPPRIDQAPGSMPVQARFELEDMAFDIAGRGAEAQPSSAASDARALRQP